MIDKKTYLQMKKDLKCLCRRDLSELCDEMELNDFEKKLLLKFYNGDKVPKICMDLCISQGMFTIYLKTVFSKIHHYKNTH